MGRKKKEETGAHVTPATEAGEIEVVETYKVESVEEYNDRLEQTAELQNNGFQVDADSLTADNKELPADIGHTGYTAGRTETIEFIALNELEESPTNPRKHYDEKGLDDLAESISTKGLIQPLVVRKIGLGAYQVVAGARRLRAGIRAGMGALPCIVKDYSDAEVLEIQVIENNQREDVHPLEEGEGYAALLKVEGYTVEAIAGKIGRSDKYVRERLQLAKLSPKVKEKYQKNKIFYTHARLLSRLTIEQQDQAVEAIMDRDHLVGASHPMNVKALEYWIESNIEKSLGSASFPIDDATINKQAGACVSCQFNTATDMQLFPDYATSNKKGVCLKPECFKDKVKKYADRLIKEKLKADEKGEMLLVSKRGYYNTVKKMPDGTERVIVGWDNWEKAKKGEKGAVEALLMGSQDMEDKGKTVWVKLKNKKDAKPSKSDSGGRSSSSGSGTKAETPEEKAERERLNNWEEYVNDMTEWLLFDELIKKYKNISERTVLEFIKDYIENGPDSIEAWVSGIDVDTYKYLGYKDREAAVYKGLKKFNHGQLLFIATIGHMFEWKRADQVAKEFSINFDNIKKAAEEKANVKYPDPAKALIVNFAGLKYGLKESDYRAELEYISNELRKQNKKEGKDYKELNIINPGGNNVFFRKDAKTGLYRFSTWIDSDGTAMGFDKLPEAKFIKLVKGFKLQAAGKKKSEGKSKKAKKK